MIQERRQAISVVAFRSILIAAIAWSVAAPAVAETCRAIHVRNPAGNYIIPGAKGDIPYSDNLALDAYIQPDQSRPPTVIVVHGGGWSSGSRIAHVSQILEFLTKAGYNWVSLDYRLDGLARYEEALADIRAAISFIRCHAEDFRIDADQLVLLGEDSGAQLTALISSERAPGIVGAILIGGFYDLKAIPSIARDASADILVRASPLAAAPPITTPVLVIHGGADSESPTGLARRYCDRVVAFRGRCQFVEVEGASHRSENWWPNQWHYKAQLGDWLGDIAKAPAATTAGAADARTHKDIPYRHSPTLLLDAYIPPAAVPTPAVIVVHGGGWEAGDKVTYITPMLEPLARAGLAWFSIDYRLTPSSTHENQMEDLREAVRFVRTRHERFNIDPTRIVLLGESASGQMVALLAAEDRSLAGVVSFYGVYDFAAMVTDASPRSLLVRLFRRTELNDEARAELHRYSPLYRVHKDMPPVLLVNGTGERLWPQAQAFDRQLTELEVSHEVVTLDGAPHGMENWEGHPEWMFYKERVVAWIAKVTSGDRKR